MTPLLSASNFFLVSHYVKSILTVSLVFFLIFTQATMDQYCGQIDCTLKTRCLNTQKGNQNGIINTLFNGSHTI